MDPKVLAQLRKAVKEFVKNFFILFGEEGLRIIAELVEKKLQTRAKKAKSEEKK